MKLNAVIVSGLALAGVATAALAEVPWTNANGSNSSIWWENGRSDNGLFGSPTVIGDTFFFISNNNFDAQAYDGSTQTTTDTLRVRVHAQPGRVFTQVIFASQGDYTVFGSGASVNVTGQLTVNDVNSPRNATSGFNTIVTPSFGSATAMPVQGNDTEPEIGIWNGAAMIDFAVFGFPPVTDLDLIFTNTLIAVALPGETAAIATLPNTQGAFTLSVVPAPGTLAGLLGLGLLVRRRR
jgi:hypothetical protein